MKSCFYTFIMLFFACASLKAMDDAEGLKQAIIGLADVVGDDAHAQVQAILAGAQERDVGGQAHRRSSSRNTGPLYAGENTVVLSQEVYDTLETYIASNGTINDNLKKILVYCLSSDAQNVVERLARMSEDIQQEAIQIMQDRCAQAKKCADAIDRGEITALLELDLNNLYNLAPIQKEQELQEQHPEATWS